MNSALIERLKIAGERIVAEGVAQYERDFGRFSVSLTKTNLKIAFFELLIAILDRFETDEEITILPLKQILLQVIFELELNSVKATQVSDEVFVALYKKIESEPNYDAEFVGKLKLHQTLISEAFNDLEFFSSSSSQDILREIVEYQYSNKKYSFIPREIDENRRVFTLFSKERYWETFATLTDDTSYSPLGYNRAATFLGLPQYKVSISYEDLIIYEGVLYKLNPGVSSPDREQFVPEQWVEYNSRRFDRSKSFSSAHKSLIRTLYTTFLEQGFDINEIISDSKIEKFDQTQTVDSELLPLTFGGQGKQIYDSVKELELVSEAFGGYEGSPIGGIEYATQYIEYLLASAFGRKIGEVFNIVLGAEDFGKFNVVFSSKLSQDSIPGLSFLNEFGKLRSFTHGQILPEYVDISEPKIIYNPTYVQFYKGLDDRYSSVTVPNTYSEPPRVDLLLYGIETLYRRCLAIGDNVNAILNFIGDGGKLPGYEGLGSIETQMAELQNVFPPTSYFLESQIKIGAGLTGVTKYLLDSYSRFSMALVYPELPGEALSFFPKWIELINNRLEELIDLFKNIGIGSKNYIPNLSFSQFDVKDTKLVQFLSSLGFRDSEINQLLGVESFDQLIANFAPLSNSSDLKSFFKAYELSQLIYEFGGDSGISTYLSFLYSKSPIDSLLNILSLSQKDRSSITSLQISKYPKLIGLLIGLTYAIDPAQLIKFNKILGENNLTLLESIEFLYEKGETTLIKSEQDISLLRPVIEQIIQGNYVDQLVSPDLNYSQTNTTVPIALRQWTQLIGDNLGKLSSPEVIRHLYDKSVGLTPKELISILNNPTSPTPFGELIDGFSGGEFTQFIKYANISGLAVKLSYYKNSYQADNFPVDIEATYFTLPVLLQNLEEAKAAISLVETILEGKLDFRFTDEGTIQEIIDPLVFLQNKSFEVFSEIIRAIAPIESAGFTTSLTQNSSSFSNIAGDAPIIESPGIGNSRLPNRIPAINSITPEQFEALFGTPTQPQRVQSVVQDVVNPSIINNFIKFSDENKLINSINQADETQSYETTRSKPTSYSPATRYEVEQRVGTSAPISYFVPQIYVDPNLLRPSDFSGISKVKFISLKDQKLVSPLQKIFDPIESCRRFGGTNCDSIFEGIADLCVFGYNKSLFPEEPTQRAGIPDNVVLIDRPLGTFADYKPNQSLLPTSSFKSPPSYYSLLGEDAIPGRWGEPITPFIRPTPVVYDSGNGALSEYGNSEYGIVEFIKAKLEKTTEFNCATLDSPFHYQICMNIMKCKKFVPPERGEYYLRFCPKTLSGGRLK